MKEARDQKKWISMILLTMIVSIFLWGCVKKPSDVTIASEIDINNASKLDQKIIQLITENYIPYQFKENGITKGIAVEVVKVIFERLGYTVELTLLPWTRALQMVQDGQTDGIFSAYFSVERSAYMDYMKEPLAYDEQYVYTLADSKIVFDGSLDSLEPYRIGVLQDWFYGEDFATRVKDGSLMVETVTDLPINIQKLLDGRIDAIINPQINTSYYLKQLNLQEEIVQQPAPFRKPAGLFLAFTKSRGIDPNLRKSVDEELLKMKADGTYQEIVDRYTK
jgi:polar amino acid transport system substrate-binding protein